MNKKKLFSTLFAVIVIACASITIKGFWAKNKKETDRNEARENERQEANDAAKYLWDLRVNQATGTIDPEDMINARNEVEAMAKGNNSSRMKASTINLQWEELGPDNIGGRTRAILFDKNNPDHMFAGSVAGGLWRSINHGQSWSVIDDEMQNLAVSCITQAANGDIYFGTGEGLYGYFGYNVGSFPGQGIWKSTDGGATFHRLVNTWDNLTPTQQGQWNTVNQIYADPTRPFRIYAATGTGLKMSNDSGHTWINPVRNNMTGGQLSSTATTVKVGSDGTVICAVGNQVYISDSTGKKGDDSTFRKVTSVSYSGRVELAIAPSNPNVMYACVAGGTVGLLGIYRTTDKFKTATLVGPGSNSFNPLGQQGSYANAIAVCPDNADKIIVAGFNVFSWQLNHNWSQLDGYSASNYVHPDQHTIVFNPNNPLDFFIGCDGGLFESPDQGHTFAAMNRKYNVTQFYAVAPSPEQGSTEVTGGTQDNGCLFINGVGNNAQDAINIHGGDGFYTAISYYNPYAYFVESQYAGLARSANKGSGGQDFYDGNINPATTPLQSAFNTPFLLWENLVPNTTLDTSFFIATSGAVWMTKQALNFSVQPKWYKIGSVSGAGTCLGSTNDGKVLFVGTSSNLVYRITNLDYVNNTLDNSGTNYDLTNTASLPTPIRKTTLGGGLPSGKTPTSISVDPVNNNHVLITYGNYSTASHVYESHNALNTSPTFSDITNNIPAMPCYSSLIDRWDSTIMFVGTELGVFATNDGGATWNYQTGVPRMPAFMIKQIYQYTNGNAAADIYVATHGRGFWKSSTLTGIHNLSPAAKVNISIYPNPTQEVANVSFNLNRTSPVLLDIFNINGQKVKAENLGSQTSGQHLFTINVATLPAGTYFLNATIGNEKSVKKFVISR